MSICQSNTEIDPREERGVRIAAKHRLRCKGAERNAWQREYYRRRKQLQERNIGNVSEQRKSGARGV
jgi:hypothetical protein